LIIAHIGPYAPGPRLHFGENRHSGVVTVDPLSGEHAEPSRQVCCGFLQSIPSSMYPSCDAEIETTPLAAGVGQMNT
jgi:hypothetical protein